MLRKRLLSALLLIVLLIVTGAAAYLQTDTKTAEFTSNGHTPVTEPAYQEELFDTGELAVIQIDISDENFAEITDNAYAENYVSCDITINGVTVQNVGIRAKGNGSLLMTSLAGTDRQGFKIEFDHYVDGQTYEGLDKLVLNNGLSDPTFMKEAITYDMFRYMGVASSLYNYAQVIVNGQYLGLYLALEGVEDSFLERNYGDDAGELYKPDSEGVDELGDKLDLDLTNGGGTGNDYDLSDLYRGWDYDTFLEKQENAMDFSGMIGMVSQMSAQDEESEDDSDEEGSDNEDEPNPVTALRYIGDDPDTYSLIWDSEVTKTDDEDHLRVLNSIKYISEHSGKSLTSVMDVDAMLRYMAVHTFVVNLDTIYAGSNHNYYLYEKDGKLCMLPWDYNESMGSFALADADDFINFSVDEPYYNVDLANEEFFEAILQNDVYREQYHTYLRQLCEEYVQGGRLDALYEQIRTEIDGAAEEDPTSFYTYSMYDEYAPDLIALIKLRAESVLRQIDGTDTEKKVTAGDDLHYYGHDDALLDKISLSMSSMFGGNTRLGYIMVHLKDMTYEEYLDFSQEQIYSYVQVPYAYYPDAVWTGDWCEIEAGDQKLMQFGCGLCCLTNVYDTLVANPGKLDIITPDDTFYLAKQTVAYNPDSGTGAISWQQLKKMCENWGLTAQIMRKKADYEGFQKAVAEADATIALVCSKNDDTLWTQTYGHYITLWDYDAFTDTVYLTDSSGLHNRERVSLKDVYNALKTSSKAQYMLIDTQ